LHLPLRQAYLIAAVILLLIMPWGHASVVLVLFVAADLGAAALMLRPEPAPMSSVVTLGGDMTSLNLLRRTVPELRMRRPAVAIDAQIRWRQAAEAHRRRREFFRASFSRALTAAPASRAGAVPTHRVSRPGNTAPGSRSRSR
jgi:hypothetical protein